jgi:hypothetical protein
MVVVKAKKIPKKPQRFSTADRVLGRLCVYYPQYTFNQAKRMPYKRVLMLLEIAKQVEAERFEVLLGIVVAPHTKKGEGVKKMAKYLEGIVNG